MLQAVLLDAYVLLVVHHLAVDGVSWRILLPDLAAAWQAAARELPPAGTSFRRWAGRTRPARPRAARPSPSCRYWTGVLAAARRHARRASAGPGRATPPAPCDELTVQLPPEDDRAAARRPCPRAFHADRRRRAADRLGARGRGTGPGAPAVLVMLEGHGREEDLVPGADLSRTVGWFTSRPGPPGCGSTSARTDGPGGRAQADQGTAAGGAGQRHRLRAAALPATRRPPPDSPCSRSPQIGFNYLGRFAAAAHAADAPWQPAGEGWGGGADDGMPADYALEINAVTEDHAGGPRLTATVTWPRRRARRASRCTSWPALAGCAASAHRRPGGRRTHPVRPRPGRPQPGRHRRPRSRVRGPRVDRHRVRARHRDQKTGLEDVLPLTPLQEGCSSTPCTTPSAPDVYTVSSRRSTSTGPLDADRLRGGRAGAARPARRTCGRASGARPGGSRSPVVPARATLPWPSVDLTGLAEAEPDREPARRGRPAPAVRPGPPAAAAAAPWSGLGADAHRLVDHPPPHPARRLVRRRCWSANCSISTPGRPGRAAAGHRRTGTYLAWLARRDRRPRPRRLARSAGRPGRADPARPGRPPAPEPVVARHASRPPSPAGLAPGLTALARGSASPSTRWCRPPGACCSAGTTGRDDVVFGATVSGRPPSCPASSRWSACSSTPCRSGSASSPAEPAARPAAAPPGRAGRAARPPAPRASPTSSGSPGTANCSTPWPSSRTTRGRGDRRTAVPGLRVTEAHGRGRHPLPADPGRPARASRIDLEIRHRADVFDADRRPASARPAGADPDRVRRRPGRAGRPDRHPGPRRAGAGAHRVDRQHRRDRRRPPAPPVRRDRRRAPRARRRDLRGRAGSRYAELDARSNRLARALAARGVGPGAVVAVALPRSADLVVALLGVLRSGGRLPRARPRLPGRPAAIHARRRPAGLCRSPGAELPGDADPSLDPAADGPRQAGRRASPDVLDAAYVIYTSGSTGRPKGVVVTHDGVAKLVATRSRPARRRRRPAGCCCSPRRASTSPTGSCARRCSPAARWSSSPAELRCRARRWSTTSPSTRSPSWRCRRRCSARSRPSCRLPLGMSMLVGTEEVPARLAERFARRAARMFNAYGPTETSVERDAVASARRSRPAPLPIGYPIRGQPAYVLDGGLQPGARRRRRRAVPGRPRPGPRLPRPARR